MNAKLAVIIAVSVLSGALARDFFVARAVAAEDALRREDVAAIVRSLESQARATEKQVDATRDLGRALNDVSRSCQR